MGGRYIRQKKTVPLKMFHHPRFTPKYILSQMGWQHTSPHVGLPPMLWIQQKAVRIANAGKRNCESWLKRVATGDRNASGINDEELLLIGVHLRKTDMIDVMVRSGQTTRQTVDDQIRDLLWQVATEIQNWVGACGAIVMLAADSLKGRLEATLQLYEYCTMLGVTGGSCTHICSCSCIKQADGTWTGIDACAQHWDTKKGWKRARAEHGKLREGTVQDFARDVYMLSRAHVFASCEWSSIPEVVRMVKGKPFLKDCTPRTRSP